MWVLLIDSSQSTAGPAPGTPGFIPRVANLPSRQQQQVSNTVNSSTTADRGTYRRTLNNTTTQRREQLAPVRDGQYVSKIVSLVRTMCQRLSILSEIVNPVRTMCQRLSISSICQYCVSEIVNLVSMSVLCVRDCQSWCFVIVCQYVRTMCQIVSGIVSLLCVSDCFHVSLSCGRRRVYVIARCQSVILKCQTQRWSCFSKKILFFFSVRDMGSIWIFLFSFYFSRQDSCSRSIILLLFTKYNYFYQYSTHILVMTDSSDCKLWLCVSALRPSYSRARRVASTSSVPSQNQTGGSTGNVSANHSSGSVNNTVVTGTPLQHSKSSPVALNLSSAVDLKVSLIGL